MALAKMFRKADGGIVMRATARLYLTAGSALVTENDPAARTLWREPGAEISMTDAYAYGLVPRSDIVTSVVQCAYIAVSHNDDTGEVIVTIPANSLILGALAICVEAAGGTTRPSIDFGEVGGDADGIFDGLGEEGVCDTHLAQLGVTPEGKGLGALIRTQRNEDDLTMKAQRFSMGEQIFQNTQHSAGTGTVTGEWLICILYVVLPSLATILA